MKRPNEQVGPNRINRKSQHKKQMLYGIEFQTSRIFSNKKTRLVDSFTVGRELFLGSQGRTNVFFLKKAAIPLIQLPPQMKQWPAQVTARLVITVVAQSYSHHQLWSTTNHQLQYDSRNLHYCAIYHHTHLFSVFAVNAVAYSLFGVLFFG